jgi:hypothetical protein
MNKIIITCCLLLSLLTAKAQYTLTINNGYGSGTFAAGDTVNIWAKEIPANNVFDKWSGPVALLRDSAEWHTTLIMPASNVTLTANFSAYIPFSMPVEQIRGKNNLKNVYSYFPTPMKGVIFCFHGTGGAASNWVTPSSEYKLFINDAVKDSFGVIITEAEEITLNTDMNGDGKLRWATYPLDTSNIDIANLAIITDTFIRRGKMTATTPKYGIGMSNGGFFAPSIAMTLGYTAIAPYCSQGAALQYNTITIPTSWSMAKYDNNDQVGHTGDSLAFQYHLLLDQRGICNRYNLQDHSPCYPQRFMRIPLVTQTVSTNIFNELKNNNLMDAKNYFLYPSDTFAARITASPSSYPYISALPAGAVVAISTQIDLCYSAHKFFSDYNKRTLYFFDHFCDSAKVINPNGIADLPLERLTLYPNPATTQLTCVVPHSFENGVLSIIDLCGREVLLTAVKDNTTISIAELPAGIYLTQVQSGASTLTQKLVISKQ